MRLMPEPRFWVGPPSTEAYSRTLGFQRHGTAWYVPESSEPGCSSTPVMLAAVGVPGQTTSMGASTAVGNGVTFSTSSLGSPPTRYSDGSRGSVLSVLGGSCTLYWPFWAMTSP